MSMIAFSGKMSAGKTVSANYLAEKYGYVKLAFATPLKEISSHFKTLCEAERLLSGEKLIYSSDTDIVPKELKLRDLMPDIYKTISSIDDVMFDLFESFADYDRGMISLFEDVFPKYYDLDINVDKSDLHRALLQDIGHAMRSIDPNVWTTYLIESTYDYKKVAVDDLRYKNEYDALKKAGFKIVRVNVSPEVQERRLELLYGDIDKSRLEHISETDLDDAEFDYVLDGNAPLPDMLRELDNFIGG